MLDEYYMAKAISLAKKGWYSTHPNPRVGCVLVRDDEIIAEGWHQYAGQGHAEVNALAVLAKKNIHAKGATAYVTLEPCSHFGKTPPCSNALIEVGITRVVIAMVDPNPLVSGNGVQRLQESGVKVKTGVLEAEARTLNSGFIQRMESKRPRVRCKMAMSLDGRTAMANGESKWITSADAREDVQRLRAESSVILTGIGTIIADDPSMNVRSHKYTDVKDGVQERGMRQPDRFILDTQLRTPTQAKILSLPGKTVIATAKARQVLMQQKIQDLESKGANVLFLPIQKRPSTSSLSLQATMSLMAQQQYNDVLLEAGATLTGAMLQAGFVDELIIYMAPHLMGSEARGLFNLTGLESMKQRINLNIQDIRAVGEDFRITAKPVLVSESADKHRDTR
ncbi:MAG: bifunctional diaminohydroxyphosphoribosylaminopyrimidine deaminase/5-amino-6-(5-phosphoribosylamino)uracil reductase RibD [Gammaproteobacteria bacterium]|nr:bifunctional diaminohydroxyphosphoribosylaminopyrimidine deaminase/5-amino-6-(5-phosphoribosylamino)uracil reductase RibD [Gammaproteobacteria bacterium]